jgi:predicted DNA-binding mobile mystery protein A
MSDLHGKLGRKHLDKRLAALRESGVSARPRSGWIRALRDALGITSSELGRRMGVVQSVVTRFEQGELDDSITLRSLRSVGEALNCELVYALVPRKPLDQLLYEQARAVAERQLAGTSHSMALENQSLADSDQEAERDRLIAVLLQDPRKLWRQA